MDLPLFLGLSHIGQVFSLAWSNNISKCSVFDFDQKNLNNFKEKKFTTEEPNLKKISHKKIEILENEKEILNKKIIFFTYDTAINEKNGFPNLSIIENYIKKLLSFKFKYPTTIIITSQVYPGFMESIKKKYKIQKKIKLIYMVDTLKMGTAIKNFLNPEQLIFGGENINKVQIKKLFKKFKCKKYFYSFGDAELIKISINLYLFFSVTYANILDQLGKNRKYKFSRIIQNLRNDRRIGKYAYINPSLGISGGHLERDVYYLNKIIDNPISSKIMSNMLKFNDFRKKNIIKEINLRFKKKKINILILGISYKSTSYSLVNSQFKFLFNNKNFKVSIYDNNFKFPIKDKFKRVNNLKDLGSFDILILNYTDKNSMKYIKKYFSKKRNNYLFNITSNKNVKFSGDNILNFFEKANAFNE